MNGSKDQHQENGGNKSCLRRYSHVKVCVLLVVVAVAVATVTLRKSQSQILKDGTTLILFVGSQRAGSRPDPWSFLTTNGFTQTITCNDRPTTCRLTNNYSWFDQSDVVLFDVGKHVRIRNKRNPGQMWGVYFDGPQPPNVTSYPRSVHSNDDSFNFVSSSSLLSQIPIYSHSWTNCKVMSDLHNLTSSRDYARTKARLAVQIITKCRTESRRELYVEELKKYMDVDTIGGCDKIFKQCQVHDFTCVQYTVDTTYKFVLVFEEALCPDYITEYLSKIYLMNAVPVVLGTANYAKLLPAGTFIDARDYRSPGELVGHLRKLDGNHSLYNRLIENKRRVRCALHQPYLCRLCSFLLENKAMPEIRALSQQWNAEKVCRSRKEFFKELGVNIE